jgi:phospholipid-binding lipoprotein MlaA
MNLLTRPALATLAATLVTTALIACTPVKEKHPQDPLESFNRGMFAFNDFVDGILLEPVARGYRYITPAPVRTGVSNFFGNLNEPVTFANAVLQGESQVAFRSFWRFIINSTIGLAGVIDVADSSTDLKKHTEDMGQTFASWGWNDSTYIVLPIFGPSTTRDTLGRVGDIYLHPATYYLETDDAIIYNVAEGIVLRESLLDVTDDIKETSLDPYATYRSLYLQKRAAEIGNTPGCSEGSSTLGACEAHEKE